ncbi:MAG: hypothetical protein JW955_02145 [Sedimentisphaerales bacterium]|nr:hypothetical protein [Sedimentisphaerales bacterium]
MIADRVWASVRVIGLLILALAILGGCNIPRSHLIKFNGFYEKGDLVGAQGYAQKLAKARSDPKGDDLLWALQLGAVERARKDFSQSNQWFDRAEEMMKSFDTSFKGLDVVGTTVANETVLPYRGEAYDAIMVNTYKALNFMALGNDELARVEFNRALDRQMRARERFNQEIQKLKDKMTADQGGKKVNYEETVENPDLKTRIAGQYPGLYDFQAYPDFVNPFATYLAGVFFTMTGDPGKAVDLLKESAGMLPDNRTIAEDFESVERWLDRGQAPDPAVWVVYESGLGPVKEEFRVDLPLILVTRRVYYAGIALPRLVPRPPAVESVDVVSSASRVRTELVADMDRVVQTEFSKDFPGILMRAIMATAAKVGAQSVLLNQDNAGARMLGLAVSAYSAVTTVADVRIWTSLPKQFQVARVPMPADGQITVRIGGRDIRIPVPGCRYALVYVKTISGGGEPMCNVMTRGQSEASPATETTSRPADESEPSRRGR